MKRALKKLARQVLSESVRNKIWALKPKTFKISTLVLEDIKPIVDLVSVPNNYIFREVTWDDKDELKFFFNHKGITAFDRKVPKRLNSKKCKGFAFFDSRTGEIVYNTWIVLDYKEYLKDYNLKPDFFFVFWESAECLPEHRHQGLHGRAEQEMINYSCSIGAKSFYMQIVAASLKGHNHAISKGYKILNVSGAISWPAFDIFRNLSSFLKNPFKKIQI